MFNGKQIQALEDKVDELISYIMRRDIAAKAAMDDAPANENKKIIDLLSRQAKLISKVDDLTKANKDLEKRARPKRKNKKPISAKASFKQVSEEEKAQFLEMYERGLSVLEMSTQTGRSGSCISGWIKKLKPEDFLEN